MPFAKPAVMCSIEHNRLQAMKHFLRFLQTLKRRLGRKGRAEYVQQELPLRFDR